MVQARNAELTRAVEIAIDAVSQGADLGTALLAASHDTDVPEESILAALKKYERIKALKESLFADLRQCHGGNGRARLPAERFLAVVRSAGKS